MREEILWWLELAKRDLNRALRAKDVDDKVSMVFWSQQAVEKALKAYSLYLRRDIPKTHNIRKLKEFINENLGLSLDIWEYAYELTQYYYVSRYPDIVEGIPDDVISRETAYRSVEVASKVVNAVRERLEGREHEKTD